MTGPLRIRTAKDLIEALCSPQPMVRLSTLKTIMAQPEQALAFGSYQGQDVVDALLANEMRYRKQGEWRAVVSALAAIDDPRVVAFFIELLTTADRPDQIFFAAERLAREPVEKVQSALSPLLLQNESVARARAVADLLSSAKLQSLPERIRVVMLSEFDQVDSEPVIPPFDSVTASTWLSELKGVFQAEAQECLESQGEPAYKTLLDHWEELEDEIHVWLIDWGTRNWPKQIPEVITKALNSNSELLLVAALRSLNETNTEMAKLHERLYQLAHHPNPTIRNAALRVAPIDMDLVRTMKEETSSQGRIACAYRLAEVEGERALPELLKLLYDSNWRVRAAAAEALITLGEPAAEAARPLLEHPDDTVRVGAIRVVATLAQQSAKQSKHKET